MTVNNCELGSDNIIATYAQPPAGCAMLCKFDDGCNFWRANWDGSECLLLTTDFHQVGSRRSPYSASGLPIVRWPDLGEHLGLPGRGPGLLLLLHPGHLHLHRGEAG